jgi:hypothetical protein
MGGAGDGWDFVILMASFAMSSAALVILSRRDFV